jgi:hypothetical protein
MASHWQGLKFSASHALSRLSVPLHFFAAIADHEALTDLRLRFEKTPGSIVVSRWLDL